jgi:hypothetical protein
MGRRLAPHPQLIRPEQLMRDKLGARPKWRRGSVRVTVCVGVVFKWNYNQVESGAAVITVSDRQITAGDIEYEPPQVKVCFLTPRLIILVAGSYPIHSEALLLTQQTLLGNPELDPGVIAETYASYIRKIKARLARQTYLSPLGLDKDSFFSKQKEFSSEFLLKLTTQIQNFDAGETEALLIGSDDRVTHLYMIDQNSHVTYHNDVGFAAIGIGAWHAKSQLMRAGYSNQWTYAPALALAYTAKTAAEVAPGVGKETDMYVVNRLGWMPVLPELKNKIVELHEEFDKIRLSAAQDAILKLNKYLGEVKTSEQVKTTEGKVMEKVEKYLSSSIEESYTGTQIESLPD